MNGMQWWTVERKYSPLWLLHQKKVDSSLWGTSEHRFFRIQSRATKKNSGVQKFIVFGSYFTYFNEKYPELKANQNFQALQSQLEGTENRISVARKDFIEAVKLYNLELRTMPGRLIAYIFHSDAKIKETFKTNETNQETPKVKF